MITDNILYKNIFHMLCYYTNGIKYFEPNDIDFERINSTEELLVVLMDYSFKQIYTLKKDFNHTEKALNKPYGRINIVKSYQTGLVARGKLICEVTEEDEDNIYNQIIKITLKDMIDNFSYVSKRLMNLLKDDFNTLSNITLTNIDVLNTVYRLNNIPIYYKPIWSVIKLLYEDWLALDDNGINRLLNLKEADKIAYIFQNFGLNLAKKEIGLGYSTSPSYNLYNQDGIVIRTEELDHLIIGNGAAAIFDYKFYDKTSLDNSINIHTWQVANYCTTFKIRDNNYNKVNRIRGIIFHAYKDEYDKYFKDLEAGEVRDTDIIVYSRSINLNQDFGNIKREMIDIFNWALQ